MVSDMLLVRLKFLFIYYNFVTGSTFAPSLHCRKNGRQKHACGKLWESVSFVHNILEVPCRIPCFGLFLLLWRHHCIRVRILVLYIVNGH